MHDRRKVVDERILQRGEGTRHALHRLIHGFRAEK